MKQQQDFEEFWKLLSKELSEETNIRNWTKDNNFLGRGGFTARYIFDSGKKEPERIETDVPTAQSSTIYVKKHSFQNVYPHWIGYKYGPITRSFIDGITMRSKYVISIMNHFEYLMINNK